MRAWTRRGSRVGQSPSTSTDPLLAARKPVSRRMKVVLPAPLAPSRPKLSPGSRRRLTLSRAKWGPKRRVKPRASTPLPGVREISEAVGLGLGVGAGVDAGVDVDVDVDAGVDGDAAAGVVVEVGVELDMGLPGDVD